MEYKLNTIKSWYTAEIVYGRSNVSSEGPSLETLDLPYTISAVYQLFIVFDLYFYTAYSAQHVYVQGENQVGFIKLYGVVISYQYHPSDGYSQLIKSYA